MFTGIIEAIGTIKSLTKSDGDCRLSIYSEKLNYSDVVIGDSIAVSGVCLTVIEIIDLIFTADVSNETLQCTNLRNFKEGTLVNLEKSLKPESSLGGHIVSGHVDGIATLQSKDVDGDSLKLVFTAPVELAHYIARKGSVCIDGISLTVNEVDGISFSVNIIPHTAEETTMHEFEVGREINLEVDLISRYLERLLEKNEIAEIYSVGNDKGLSIKKLQASGFIK